jgi:DNA-binding NtrC family response regulator
MTHELTGKRILVVEDEPLISQNLADQMTAEGAQVIGPVGTVEAALNVIVSTNNLDGAILDIKLIEKMSFKVADVLAARRVPFVFWTGYGCGDVVPARHAKVTCVEKPATAHEISRVLAKLLAGRSTRAPV